MTRSVVTLQAFRCDIGLMVTGIDDQRWLRAEVDLPCVPRVGDWVYVGDSLIEVERIELRAVSSEDAHIDVLAKSVTSRDMSTDDLVEECSYTRAEGWR